MVRTPLRQPFEDDSGVVGKRARSRGCDGDEALGEATKPAADIERLGGDDSHAYLACRAATISNGGECTTARGEELDHPRSSGGRSPEVVLKSATEERVKIEGSVLRSSW